MAHPLLTLFSRRASTAPAPDPQSLATRYTLGYWHAQYSNPPSALNDGDPVNEWADLSAAANSLGVGSAAPIFDITTGVNSVDEWDTETANLQFSTPLSLTGAFTFIWLVDGHTEADTHRVAASNDLNGIVRHDGNVAEVAIAGTPVQSASCDIPDSVSKVMLAFWRTSGGVVKFSATGLATVTLGTQAGTLALDLIGGFDDLYETRKVIAAGCVGADISAGLPTDAFNLGTTLTL